MADEENVQPTNDQTSGGEPPVNVELPVNDTEGSGASDTQSASHEDSDTQQPPTTVPYERFKEKNDEVKVLRTLLLNRRQGGVQDQTRQQQAPPAVQPAPAFIPPPEPDPKEYLDEYGDEDPVKKAQLYGEWAAKKTIAEHEHAQRLAKEQEEQSATVTRARQFVTKVSQKFKDFQEKIQISGNPTDHVAGAIIAMDEEDPGAAEKVAYFLASNPLEMERFNNLTPIQASVAIGRLAQKLSLPPAKPRTVSNAPNPTAPVKNTETETSTDPRKLSAPDYARIHPATENCPWLRKT